jgi:hypothetical protein
MSRKADIDFEVVGSAGTNNPANKKTKEQGVDEVEAKGWGDYEGRACSVDAKKKKARQLGGIRD